MSLPGSSPDTGTLRVQEASQSYDATAVAIPGTPNVRRGSELRAGFHIAFGESQAPAGRWDRVTALAPARRTPPPEGSAFEV